MITTITLMQAAIQKKQSDKSSASSSYQPSHSSSYDESIHSSLKLKVSSCKRILFPKQIQPEYHSQSSSIDIHNTHPQTNHRSLFTFPLMFPKIDRNIITLKIITRNTTYQNEDIPLTICRPNICHVPISPISSPMLLQAISQIPSIITSRIIKKRLPITLPQPNRKT